MWSTSDLKSKYKNTENEILFHTILPTLKYYVKTTKWVGLHFPPEQSQSQKKGMQFRTLAKIYLANPINPQLLSGHGQ